MKIRFAFHKPKGERGIGKAIVAWTWVLALLYSAKDYFKALLFNYSHVEVWVPRKRDGRFYVGQGDSKISVGYQERINGKAIIRKLYRGQCLSSTTRGKWKGVRLAPAIEVIGKHPERWDYIEVDIDPERLEVAIAECNKLLGREYDFLGIFGFFMPWNIQVEKKYYCSEICSWFAYLCRITKNRNKRISPRRLAYILSKQYGQPKHLA